MALCYSDTSTIVRYISRYCLDRDSRSETNARALITDSLIKFQLDLQSVLVFRKDANDYVIYRGLKSNTCKTGLSRSIYHNPHLLTPTAMDASTSYTAATSAWFSLQALPLLLYPRLIITLLSPTARDPTGASSFLHPPYL